jgi:transcription antitermination factor NusG
MDKKSEFSEGDTVRVKRGAFASFVGKVIRVDNASGRLTVEGRFEGQPDFRPA